MEEDQDGIGAVVGMACGQGHSLVTTGEGCVLGFGSNGEYESELYQEDSDEEWLDEPVFVVDGRLGLGAGAEVVLTPTAIDGITIGDGVGEEKEGKE